MTQRPARRPSLGITSKLARTATLSLALAVAGCFARPAEEVKLSVPHAAGPAVVSPETRKGPIALSAVVEGTRLDVTAMSTTECHLVTTTPMTQEVDTHRYTPRIATLGNAIGATVFVVGGVAALPDSSSGVQTGIGVALIGIGAVFVSALIANGVRAKDTHETVPAKPTKEATPFVRCEGAPAEGTDLSVTLGTVVLRGETGKDGHASFELGTVDPSDDVTGTPIAHVREGYGRAAADIDLSGTPLLAKWKAAADESAERQRKQKKEEEERDLRLQKAERQQAGH